MSHTTSLGWPNMFNVARNCVAVLEDGPAVLNRTRLLLLSSPTEMYNDPPFGLGLRRHMYTYNDKNREAILKDEISRVLTQYEPYVNPAETVFQRAPKESVSDNHLAITVGLVTTFNTAEELKL